MPRRQRSKLHSSAYINILDSHLSSQAVHYALKPPSAAHERMTGSERERYKSWFSSVKRDPVEASSGNRNTSGGYTSPRNSNKRRSLLDMGSWRKTPAAEQPDDDRRKRQATRFPRVDVFKLTDAAALSRNSSAAPALPNAKTRRIVPIPRHRRSKRQRRVQIRSLHHDVLSIGSPGEQQQET